MTATAHEKKAVRPLNVTGTIYAIYDNKGNVIGTGSREVCETLLYIINKSSLTSRSTDIVFMARRSNVRSAIAI